MVRWSFVAGLALTGALVQVQVQGQAPPPDLTDAVRTAMASGGLIAGEKVLAGYRAARGSTPDAIDALLWLARGALSAQQFDKANQYANESRGLALATVTTAPGDARAWHALGQSIEILALTLAGQGARSDAIYLLQNESAAYPDSPIHDSLAAAISDLTLEGQPAPALAPGSSLGPRTDASDSIRQPTLLFFWAHWCQECKAESAMIGRLVEKYRARGLVVVAPTRRYGYVDGGRNATPERELRHIVQVRDRFYPFLKKAWVPVTDVNHRSYGIAAIPMHILVDAGGVVRLYRPGRMQEAELESAILKVLAP